MCNGGVVRLRASLFDMDGLLLDSEILWHKAELEIFGALGVPIAHDVGSLDQGDVRQRSRPLLVHPVTHGRTVAR